MSTIPFSLHVKLLKKMMMCRSSFLLSLPYHCFDILSIFWWLWICKKRIIFFKTKNIYIMSPNRNVWQKERIEKSSRGFLLSFIFIFYLKEAMFLFLQMQWLESCFWHCNFKLKKSFQTLCRMTLFVIEVITTKS